MAFTTDSPALAQAASRFDEICGNLEREIQKVEQHGSELQAAWKGQSALAAGKALGEFKTAADKQQTALSEIQNDLGHTSKDYEAQDSEQASNMGF